MTFASTPPIPSSASWFPLGFVNNYFNYTWEMIGSIVQTALIFFGSTILARRHPFFFFSGLVVGVICDQMVAETSQKIQQIFEKSLFNKVTMLYLTGLTLPIAADFLIFGFGAKLASVAVATSRRSLGGTS